jgi:hypothetical protein
MLNQKQFGCLKFLSVNFNDTQLQSKNFPPGKRHPGHRFLRTACQPIRIENFEKSYNNITYFLSFVVTSLPHLRGAFPGALFHGGIREERD